MHSGITATYGTLGETLFAISGVKTADGIDVDNTKKTVTLKSVNRSNGAESASQTEGCFLDNNKAPTITAPKGITYTAAVNLTVAEPALEWKIGGTTTTLSADIGATYNVANNKVTFAKPKKGVTQAVLTGINKNAALTLPTNKVITLSADVLDSKTSLKSNAGDYSIKLTGNMNGKIFFGTSGSDEIIADADNAAVNGGAGNDIFSIKGENVTVTGGKGNDTFRLQEGATLIYGSGDGKDSVNFVEGLKISLSGSAEIKSISQNDSDIILDFGRNSSVTVTDAGEIGSFELLGKKQNLTVNPRKFALVDDLAFDKEKSPSAVTISTDTTLKEIFILKVIPKPILYTFIYADGDVKDFIYGFDDNPQRLYGDNLQN